MRVTRLGGVTGLAGIKSWFPNGIITPDTTYYKTASPSQKLSPSSPTVLNWVASTAKSLGAYVQPTTHNNFYYYAMNAGTTAAAGYEPTWPTTLGTTVLDNDILWFCVSRKLESGKKQFAMASGSTATVTVWIRKSAAYSGNQPRLMLKANPDVGVNSDTVLATMAGGVDVDVGPGTFTQLSGTTPAASQDGVMEVVVDCDGTAGFVNVDWWGFA